MDEIIDAEAGADTNTAAKPPAHSERKRQQNLHSVRQKNRRKKCQMKMVDLE